LRLASPSSSHSSPLPWSYTMTRLTLLRHGTCSSSTKRSPCYVCCTIYSCSDEQCGSSILAVSSTAERYDDGSFVLADAMFGSRSFFGRIRCCHHHLRHASASIPTQRIGLGHLHQPKWMEQRRYRLPDRACVARIHVCWTRRSHPSGRRKQKRYSRDTSCSVQYLDHWIRDVVRGVGGDDVQCAGLRQDSDNCHRVRTPEGKRFTASKSMTLLSRLPAFELLRQGMQSDAAATVMMVAMLVAALAALTGCQQVVCNSMQHCCHGTRLNRSRLLRD
jgi:hypothetical protein